MDDLADRLTALTFSGLTQEQVTALLIDAVVEWGEEQGWRVYRRAPSVMRLPPPMERQHSVLDVALARPGAPPVVVEVDHTDRKRTVEKLLAEAEEGRIPFWVRWGPGRIADAPPPIEVIAVSVTRHQGRYSRSDLAAPEHSPRSLGPAEATELPLPGEGR
ncbi:hypothetical protein [Actinoplanes sp. NPDC051859]|uniref:hypothetical protein n=1 Tax=Actinoplanes sp. NPDC051859 TaxID=3363909 RepID=UPI0037A38728